jgi:glycosyltransferase involved in cell wall biosynthesis
VLRRFFGLPAGYLFLTPEEAELVGARAERLGPSAVIGCGLDPANVAVDPAPLGTAGIDTPYVLYLGRVDPNKGCDALIRHFLRYRSNAETRVPLILAGPANMPLPESPSIRALGYVDDRLREALLAHASLLVVPSPYESLSMVLLEAWNHGVPVLVNARCAVTRGQTSRADGGLYYRNAAEFDAALEYLLTRGDVARTLGAQGRAYVDREYRWQTVMKKIEQLLEQV